MSTEAEVTQAPRKTRRSLLRPFERRKLREELAGTSRDIIAIFGSLFTAFNFAQLVGYQFKIPPLEFLLYHWKTWTAWIWSQLLFAYPYRVNAPALTYLLVMCCMFLRGRYGRYASFRNFSPPTQMLLLRIIYWLLALTFVVVTLAEHRDAFLATPVHMLAATVAFLFAFALGYGLLSVYVWLLKKTKLLLYYVRHPYLIFTFLLAQFSIDFLSRAREASRREALGILQAADTADVTGAGIALVGASLWIGILPFALWYIRIFLAVCLSIAALFTIDFAWGWISASLS